MLAVDVEKSWNALRIGLGHFPVLFFFVLSGYVLGRPLTARRFSFSFAAAYLTKRIFRLCPLLILVFLVSYVGARFLEPEQLSEFRLNQWVLNLSAWMAQVRTPQQLWENLLLIQRGLNVPTWTIKVELICSMLLPFTILLFPRTWGVRMTVGLVLLFFGSAWFLQLFSIENEDLTWFQAARYLYLFYFGFLVVFFDRFFDERRRPLAAALLVGSFLLLISSLWLPWGSDASRGALMAVLLVVLSPLPFPRVRAALDHHVPLLLGHLSYGIYLFHVPVLLFLLAGPLPPLFLGTEGLGRFPVLFVQVFAVTLLLSFLANKLLEDPLNGIGHRLAARISNRLPR